MAGHFDDGTDMGETHEINVTPLVDVMLVLLIIFMVAAPLSTVELPVDLPTARSAPPPKDDKPVTITISADHAISIGTDIIAPGGIITALDGLTAGNHERRVLLRADKTAPYGDVIIVLDDLKAAGYVKLALVGLEAGK
jgi:biopolymer transport protein ExbD